VSKPDKLTVEQQRQALAALRSGRLMDELGVTERAIWRSLNWDSLDSALQEGVVRNLDRAARRLAESLPRCRELLAGGGPEP
jgi:hypothetical protein